jgi:hypothetical protein
VGLSVAVSREYAIACTYEQHGERGSWDFWFERWIGTGSYWICHPTIYAGGVGLGVRA